MTGRGQREGVAAEFLRDVLAGRALGVPKLEAMARTAGLLGEGQRITHVKVFKKAKKSLGIRSVRNGFGDAGEWLWQLERQPFTRLEALGSTTPIHRGHLCGSS